MKSRLPRPWLGLMGLIGAALWRNKREFAVMLILHFVLYLRAGELLSLRSQQLVRPVPEMGTAGQHWAVILGDFELGTPGKTGEFDESVVLDWHELAWMSPLLEQLKGRPPQVSIWQLDYAGYIAAFKQAVLDANIEVLVPVPYSLRHGGASHDMLSGRRAISAIKRRGRWASDASVRRYEKAARALKEAGRIPKEARTYAGLIEANLASFALGREKPPRPPGV